MSFNGWAVALGGVLTTQCGEHEVPGCVDHQTVIACLNGPPDGLDLPGLRTEDTEYFQRDGVKHFNDYYTARQITLTATVSATDDCADCATARQLVLEELGQQWKRTCCDTELVVFPPCDVPHTAENAYPPTECAPGFGFGEGPFGEGGFGGGTGCDLVATNLAANPSAETETGWETSDTSTLVTFDTTIAYVGSMSVRSTKDTDNDSVVLASVEHCGEDGTTGIDVVDETTYTGSVWVRAAQTGYSATVTLEWDTGSPDVSDPVVLAAGVWTRVNVTAEAPTGATVVNIICDVVAPVEAVVGDYVNLDAAMLTESALIDYFDGDTEPTFNTELEVWEIYGWAGDPDVSVSTKSIQAAKFHGTIATGPYGFVGRPRVFDYKWLNHDQSIADIVMRFDAVDQRGYILDECGTPGTTSCVSIEPGSQQYGACFTDGMCLTTGSFCANTPLDTEDSVAPTAVGVGGTEKVYPTITLFGPLVKPWVEIVTTGEYVQLDATITGSPVTINTEEGTAFDNEGNSLTHLLRGSLFLSMYPGNYEWRLISLGGDETETPGYATVCWRDTIVLA